MGNQYETGNAKNVANFQKLIEQVSVYQEYNPSVANLKMDSLTVLLSMALDSITMVEEKRNVNKNAIHGRQEIYENLKPTCTRIINQLEILNISSGVLDQAKSLNRLIQGSKKKGKGSNKNFEEETKSVSTSRQSYTQLANNFSKLLQLLSTIPSYNPNIEDLKLKNLNIYYSLLVDMTKEVDRTGAELNTKIIERDNILYGKEGLYNIAQNIKKYIKSLYGATAPQYFAISKIKFTTN